MIIRFKSPMEVEEFVWVDGALLPLGDVQHLLDLRECGWHSAVDHDPAVTLVGWSEYLLV